MAWKLTRLPQGAVAGMAFLFFTVTTAALEQKLGQFLPARNEFCQIVDRTSVRARLLVRDWDLAQVDPGANVDLKALAFPFRTYLLKGRKDLAGIAGPVRWPNRRSLSGWARNKQIILRWSWIARPWLNRTPPGLPQSLKTFPAEI